ncbi:dihydrofolate reductase family protein [Streptomyces sp. x-19]|uniref:dihydrofolate reductase family protein n=1 Tax=Streptomyces sp. x-19 TaxID=2789280 RepID=UPI0039814742
MRTPATGSPTAAGLLNEAGTTPSRGLGADAWPPVAGTCWADAPYQDVLAHWNTQDSPFRDAFSNAPKYVTSNTLTEPLPWANSTLFSGDILAAIVELKKTPGNDLHIMGSGALIQSLSPLGLIDEYLLCIHPLVLGAGRRLFAEDFSPTTFNLADATPTASGVIIASYRPHTST